MQIRQRLGQSCTPTATCRFFQVVLPPTFCCIMAGAGLACDYLLLLFTRVQVPQRLHVCVCMLWKWSKESAQYNSGSRARLHQLNIFMFCLVCICCWMKFHLNFTVLIHSKIFA